MFNRHALICPEMRTILLEWMTEVCECENLHRETFHLAVDLLDRYISKTYCLEPRMLQLLGVTSLFIAAKLEEIYPPKVERFASVTDGAACEDDIRLQELVLLKTLNWSLSPVTAVQWLGSYLQLLVGATHWAFTDIDRGDFVQLVQILDLCLMDVNCLRYSYSMLAASLIYSTFEPPKAILRLSGFSHAQLVECSQWLCIVIKVLQRHDEVHLRVFEGVPKNDWHNIQTHARNTVHLLRLVTRESLQAVCPSAEQSPEIIRKRRHSVLYPTPPSSDKRLHY